MILSFWTDRSGQTVQTQIRLLLEGPSDQDLHCLLFHLYLLEAFFCCKANLLEFWGDYSNILDDRKLRKLYRIKFGNLKNTSDLFLSFISTSS